MHLVVGTDRRHMRGRRVSRIAAVPIVARTSVAPPIAVATSPSAVLGMPAKAPPAKRSLGTVEILKCLREGASRLADSGVRLLGRQECPAGSQPPPAWSQHGTRRPSGTGSAFPPATIPVQVRAGLGAWPPKRGSGHVRQIPTGCREPPPRLQAGARIAAGYHPGAGRDVRRGRIQPSPAGSVIGRMSGVRGGASQVEPRAVHRPGKGRALPF